MSAKILSDPLHRHQLKDDLESLLYITTWTAMRFFPTNIPRSKIVAALRSLFDPAVNNDLCDAGSRKSSFIATGIITGAPLEILTANETLNEPMTELIVDLQALFKVRYEWTKVNGRLVAMDGEVKEDAVLDVLAKHKNSSSWPSKEKEQWADRVPTWQGFDYGPMVRPSSWITLQTPDMRGTKRSISSSDHASDDDDTKRSKGIDSDP
jgi:hypothetical protein